MNFATKDQAGGGRGYAMVQILALLGGLTMGAVAKAGPVSITSPVTHLDWILATDPAPAWGPEGVRQILDRAKQCGWSAVYWRCFDAGKACYASKLLEPFDAGEPVNIWTDNGWMQFTEKMKRLDYGSFDTFKEALEYGRSIGLQVWAWLTINEDDHGYGWRSKFSREHPEFRWVRRDGRPYNSQLSFAFREVRAYKLNLVREIVSYRPDGIFFDWIRIGDVRDNPQTDPSGVANYGYEEPNLRAFAARYGLDAHAVANDDERWVRVRAEPQTEFMREAREVIRSSCPEIPVVAMVQHPWSYRGAPDDTPYADNLRGLLCDIKTWARFGLLDGIIGAGYYREAGTPESVYRHIVQETEGRVPVWLYGWLSGSPEQFRADVALAERLGAPVLLLWESNYIGLPPAHEEAVRAMKEYSEAQAIKTTNGIK